MAVDEKALKNHPGKNPDYDAGMKARRDAQDHNKAAAETNAANAALGIDARVPFVRVPRAPNKYIPHAGAKQQARGK